MNHLLKRGKLTQRLETIRKGMNERRAGDLVVDVAYSGVEGNSIIQSQKIMSEETGHYILIKRSETSKPGGMCLMHEQCFSQIPHLQIIENFTKNSNPQT